MDKELFVTCSAGLDVHLTEELKELGFNNIEPGFRGLYVPYKNIEDIFKINYLSRIASRVLLPIYEFKIQNAKSVYDESLNFEWEKYLNHRLTFAIDYSVDSSHFNNSLYAAQLLKDALCDRLRNVFKERPDVSVKSPDVQIHLFIKGNKATVSIDTSLEPLHKRGYREEGGIAPLQENLAAALLRIAKYNKDEILTDPCCGSATFLIEAAMIASNTPPGYLRKQWGFMRLPDFLPEKWIAFKNKCDQAITDIPDNHLFGIDINRTRVLEARGNVRKAGFQKKIDITIVDFKTYIPKVQPTLWVANPPYGKRLDEEEDLIPLYRSLGDLFKKYSPNRAFVLTSSMPLSKEVGLKASKRHVVSHGGLEARWLEYVLY